MHNATRLQQVQTIADAVNLQVGESAQFERFMEVYRDFGGEQGAPGLVTPSRRYVADWAVETAYLPLQDSRFKPRSLFLFNDLLAVGEALTPEGSAAAGGGGGTMRGKSLKRISVRRLGSSPPGSASSGAATGAAGINLERSWSSFIGGMFGGGGGKDSSNGGANGSRGPAGSTDGTMSGRPARKASRVRRPRNYRMTLRADLQRVSVTDPENTPGVAGIAGLDKLGDHLLAFTVTARALPAAGANASSSSDSRGRKGSSSARRRSASHQRRASTNRGSSSSNTADGAGGGAAEKMQTIVTKMLVRFQSQEQMDEVVAILREQQKVLEERMEAHQQGQDQFGSKQGKEKRAWQKKKSAARARTLPRK